MTVAVLCPALPLRFLLQLLMAIDFFLSDGLFCQLQKLIVKVSHLLYVGIVPRTKLLEKL